MRRTETRYRQTLHRIDFQPYMLKQRVPVFTVEQK